MAKPTQDPLRPAASSSTSTRRLKASPSASSHPLNRCSRSRPARSRLLPLLAAISATPLSIHAYPLDPTETSLPFLYPPFLHQPTPLAKRSVTPSTLNAATASGSTPSPPPAPSSGCQYDKGNLPDKNLPDKYVLGDDGRWHKVTWSLYGSVNCPAPCLPTANNDLSKTDRTNSPPPSPIALDDDFDLSSLPTGWTSFAVNGSSHRGTVVVLALSVALALIIIVLMFVCIFWRRKHIPKRDPEKRRRKYSGSPDDDSNRSIREAKAAQKKWIKAASRWRDNLRISAHRRRTNRALAPAASCSTLAQEDVTDAQSQSSLSYFRPTSPTLTERSATPTPSDIRSSSTTSLHSSHYSSPLHIQTPRVPRFTDPDPDPPPSSPPPAQPPAYDPPPSDPESHASPGNTYSGSSLAGTSKAPLPSHTQSQPRGDDDGHHSSLSGHVATDDKAILSLRAAMASAPPDSNSSLPQSVMVPSVEDVDTFEWPSGSWPSSPSPDDYGYEFHPPYSPPTSMLPPPPSKEKQRFDYSHDLDISVNLGSVTVEPQLGPSAPPFEECEAVPSAPPLDFDVHVPSAPPLDSEDFPDTTSGSEDSANPGATSTIPAPVVPSLQHTVDSTAPA